MTTTWSTLTHASSRYVYPNPRAYYHFCYSLWRWSIATVALGSLPIIALEMSPSKCRARFARNVRSSREHPFRCISRERFVLRSTRNPTIFCKPLSTGLILSHGTWDWLPRVLHTLITSVSFELAHTSSAHLIRGFKRFCFPNCSYVISMDNHLILLRKTSDWSMCYQYIICLRG